MLFFLGGSVFVDSFAIIDLTLRSYDLISFAAVDEVFTAVREKMFFFFGGSVLVDSCGAAALSSVNI